MEPNLQIYVLELEGGKWYVGKTTDAMARFQQHLNGEGSAWTRAHKPVKMAEIVPGDAFDEDKVTKRYMSKYGIDNVRGGSYVTMELTESARQMLQKEINMTLDKCALCGVSGHFIKDCPANKPSTMSTTLDKSNVCERCGRKGHSADKCYAKVDINGKFINKTHVEANVITKVSVITNTPIIAPDTSSHKFCGRCGRGNHIADGCYAKTNIAGKYIKKDEKLSWCEICGVKGHSAGACAPVEEKKEELNIVEPVMEPPSEPILTYMEEIEYDIELCARCGRNGHSADGCSIRSDIEGHYIRRGENHAWCEKCGEKGHTVAECHTPLEKPMLCSRCGRTNHLVDKCYAASDIDNRILLAIGDEYECKVCKDLIYHNQPCDHGKSEMKNKMMKDMMELSKNVMRGAKNASRGDHKPVAESDEKCIIS